MAQSVLNFQQSQNFAATLLLLFPVALARRRRRRGFLHVGPRRVRRRGIAFVLPRVLPLRPVCVVVLEHLVEPHCNFRRHRPLLRVVRPAAAQHGQPWRGAGLGARGPQLLLCCLDNDLEVKHKVFVVRVGAGVLAEDAAVHQLPQDDAHRVDVALLAEALAKVHLWGAIRERASHFAQRAEIDVAAYQAGQSKVRHLDVPVRGDQEVEALEISVHN
mmetsp:Transcript_19681/g.49958  ORF Transcript_19681/g.49958 Transcript_19681/m.49958 type:complete len:217 (+) Transcript_19681:113-763(+)